MGVIKKVEIGFDILYQKGLLKICSVEKVGSLGMGERIPLKRTEMDGRKEHYGTYNC